jgi:hypothetical protein
MRSVAVIRDLTAASGRRCGWNWGGLWGSNPQPSEPQGNGRGLIWSISGSAHIGNYKGTDVGPTVGSYFYRYILSRFEYGHYRLYADCLEGNNLYQGNDISEALSWVGGGQNSSYTISYWDNRSHSLYDWYDFGPGYFWDRSSYNLAHISGAVDAFGASLGAQSGASSYVKYHYDFGSNAHHYLYGLSAYPYDAGAVYASYY